MDLRVTHKLVQSKIESIDFNKLWTGFIDYDFALYNQEKVVFKDKEIPVNDQFVGNTAIEYEGNYLAIWQLTYDMDIDVLTSKIIHEMFHAFQKESSEKRFPNEFKNLIHYQQSLENLNIKYNEHKLLISLLDSFNQDDFRKLICYRSYRKKKFPYEYDYETKIEVVEGMAQFVELESLKQLNLDKHNLLLNQLEQRIVNPNLFFPIRIISYDVGTLLAKLMIDHSLKFDHSLTSTKVYLDDYLMEYKCDDLIIEDFDEVSAAYLSEIKQVKKIVNDTINSQEPILSGHFKVLAFNVYNSRYYDGFVISQYFIMTEEKGLLYGDYVFDYDGQFAKKIYKVEGALQWN